MIRVRRARLDDARRIRDLRGLDRLHLDATRNGLAFYHAQGYRVVRRRTVVIGGVRIPATRMAKRL